jgi:hypothetical protein
MLQRYRWKAKSEGKLISARNATFATYERERDLSLKRKERNEYKEGEFERVRDAQRADYAAAMGRAYAEFQAREARQAVAALPTLT